jgi:hypothetical protein
MRSWGFILGGLFLGAALPAMGQCALCRSAVESGDPLFAQVLRSGILVLLVMPYLLGVMFAVLLWRARRRKRKRVGVVNGVASSVG